MVNLQTKISPLGRKIEKLIFLLSQRRSLSQNYFDKLSSSNPLGFVTGTFARMINSCHTPVSPLFWPQFYMLLPFLTLVYTNIILNKYKLASKYLFSYFNQPTQKFHSEKGKTKRNYIPFQQKRTIAFLLENQTMISIQQEGFLNTLLSVSPEIRS